MFNGVSRFLFTFYEAYTYTYFQKVNLPVLCNDTTNKILLNGAFAIGYFFDNKYSLSCLMNSDLKYKKIINLALFSSVIAPSLIHYFKLTECEEDEQCQHYDYVLKTWEIIFTIIALYDLVQKKGDSDHALGFLMGTVFTKVLDQFKPKNSNFHNNLGAILIILPYLPYFNQIKVAHLITPFFNGNKT